MNEMDHQIRPLSVDECRELMGWHNRSDDEIQEFLNGLRRFLGHYLDQYYHDEFSLD
jgi:hypothetical protein